MLNWKDEGYLVNNLGSIFFATISTMPYQKSRVTQLLKQILREDIASLWKRGRQKRETKIFHQLFLFFSEKLVNMVDLVDQKNGPLFLCWFMEWKTLLFTSDQLKI